MEVILKEDVPKLGNRGEVVKVAEGYGRNFLLPKKLAIEATTANKTVIEQMKAASVRRSAKEKTEAEALAKQFDGLEVKFLRKSGEGDQLFGSVTAGDIAEALEKKSFHIDRRKIQLHESLKTVGEFTIPIKLHKDVTTHLKVVVEKEPATQDYFYFAVLVWGRAPSPVQAERNSPVAGSRSNAGFAIVITSSNVGPEELLYFFQVRCSAVRGKTLHKPPPVRLLQNPVVEQSQQTTIVQRSNQSSKSLLQCNDGARHLVFEESVAAASIDGFHPSRNHRIARNGKRQAIDDHAAQLFALHVHALPERRCREEHRIGIPADFQCGALRDIFVLAGRGRARRTVELRDHRSPAVCRSERSGGCGSGESHRCWRRQRFLRIPGAERRHCTEAGIWKIDSIAARSWFAGSARQPDFEEGVRAGVCGESSPLQQNNGLEKSRGVLRGGCRMMERRGSRPAGRARPPVPTRARRNKTTLLLRLLCRLLPSSEWSHPCVA